MQIEALKALFARDLKKLETEIGLYCGEENLWKTDKHVANSGGNLCLHLIGNLNTYIGAAIGNTDYIRNREKEFSLKNIPKKELIGNVVQTEIVVAKSLSNVTDEQLLSEYPMLVFEHKTSVAYMLMHLAAHLAYHLGQINYHRRLLD